MSDYGLGRRAGKSIHPIINTLFNQRQQLLEALKREHWIHIVIASDTDMSEHDQDDCPVCQLIKEIEGEKE